MLLLILCWLVIPVLIIPLAIFLHRREARQAGLCFKLSEDWRRARFLRRRWLEENSFLPNPFSDPSYRSLWQREIDAESRLYHHCPSLVAANSFNEYLEEEKRFSMF